MAKHVLPIVHPPLYGLLSWAYTLSITSSMPNFNPWFYSNFIQVCCNKNYLEDKQELFFDFFRGGNNELNHNPFLLSSTLDTPMLYEIFKDKLHPFLIKKIQEGVYPVLFLDEYHISYTTAYHAYPFPHHVLIYGYDEDRQIYHTYGFGKDLLLGYHETTFDELEQAFHSIDNYLKNHAIYDQYNYFFTLLPQFVYSLNIRLIYEQLGEYLRSESSNNDQNRFFSPDKEFLAFGIACYDHLIEHFHILNERPESLVRANPPRQLHLLWEHKKMLRNRVAYLQKENQLPLDETLLLGFLELEELARQSRNLYAEHVVKEVPHVNDRIKQNLEHMRDKELQLLPQLMDQLKQHHPELLLLP
ncbi:hypothetical protein [Paenibacillus paeoniae]|uniref:Butirosin biosynthesis protein H N-terminal domain-containing protein n=1 Tax=Paenibacillus paeoniae TaxID=2292705 RepID=A0A371PIF3_9BACL|nr:hypothetical protein [Paenibacillus paeoniae]REK76010.1 hypothetical protein DX130_02800 [Paenibacillus paeoniae]